MTNRIIGIDDAVSVYYASGAKKENNLISNLG
jgi:hypothetical protein